MAQLLLFLKLDSGCGFERPGVRKLKKSTRLFYALLLTGTIVACAPYESPQYEEDSHSENTDSRQGRAAMTTGFQEFVPSKEDPNRLQLLTYTPSGDVKTFEELKQKEQAAPKHSKTFAEKIRAAYIDQKVEEDKRTFKIQIKFEDLTELLLFEYQISEDNIYTETTTKSTTLTDDGYEYSINSLCENNDCSVIRITFQQLKNQQVHAQTSLLYTVKVKKYHVQIAESEKETSSKTIQKLQQVNEVKTESIDVVDGISKSTLTVTDPNDSNKELLVVETPIAKTHEEAIEAEDMKAEGVAKARLQGNNPKTGKLVVEVETEDGTRARLFVGQEKAQEFAQVEAQEIELAKDFKNAVLPIVTHGFDAEKLNSSLEVTKRLEFYRNHKNTLKYIKYFETPKPKANSIGSCNMRQTYNSYLATRFLTQMKAKIPDTNLTLGEVTSRILNKVDAPVQTAYLVALESPYVNNGFNADIITPYQKQAGYSNAKLQELGKKRWQFWSDAAGPYQCITDTCRYIIRKNKKLLDLAGLNPQVFYVTSMEREMYNQAIASGKSPSKIKRGDFRKAIFNSGKEADYAEQRKKASLHDQDARKYFSTATLLAGLVIKDYLKEKKAYDTSKPALPSKLEFKRKLREDPALAYYAYYAGVKTMTRSAICAQISDEAERNKCKAEISRDEIRSRRHEGFNATLEQITELQMADCRYLNYTWAWLALQFMGSNPELYDVNIGTPNSAGLYIDNIFPEGMEALAFEGDGSALKAGQQVL